MSTPHLAQCAGVILRDRQGRVLLLRQNYKQRKWVVPGGVVEAGETPHQAAIREAMEAIGVQVELTSIIGTYLTTGAGRPTIQSYMFTGQVIEGEPHQASPEEIAALYWCDLDDLPSPLASDVEGALIDLKAGVKGVVRTVQRKR